jgi:hypothetical protein
MESILSRLPENEARFCVTPSARTRANCIGPTGGNSPAHRATKRPPGGPRLHASAEALGNWRLIGRGVGRQVASILVLDASRALLFPAATHLAMKASRFWPIGRALYPKRWRWREPKTTALATSGDDVFKAESCANAAPHRDGSGLPWGMFGIWCWLAARSWRHSGWWNTQYRGKQWRTKGEHGRYGCRWRNDCDGWRAFERREKQHGRSGGNRRRGRNRGQPGDGRNVERRRRLWNGRFGGRRRNADDRWNDRRRQSHRRIRGQWRLGGNRRSN